jgi:hypothetical protein
MALRIPTPRTQLHMMTRAIRRISPVELRIFMVNSVPVFPAPILLRIIANHFLSTRQAIARFEVWPHTRVPAETTLPQFTSADRLLQT